MQQSVRNGSVLPRVPDPEPPPPPPPGAVVFKRILTTDKAVGLRFYGRLFGWEFTEEDPLRFSIINKGQPIGAALIFGQRQPDTSNVILYVNTHNLKSMIRKAKRLGATLVNGPVAIGNGIAFADLRDPNGTTFGLYTNCWR